MASREDSKVSFSAAAVEVEVVSSTSYWGFEVEAVEGVWVGWSGRRVS